MDNIALTRTIGATSPFGASVVSNVSSILRRARLVNRKNNEYDEGDRNNIAATWPWAIDIVTAWDRIRALPQAP